VQKNVRTAGFCKKTQLVLLQPISFHPNDLRHYQLLIYDREAFEDIAIYVAICPFDRSLALVLFGYFVQVGESGLETEVDAADGCTDGCGRGEGFADEDVEVEGW
jgi:hypothetical protein